MTYYIYMLHCADDTYYTGLTSDLKRRLREHASGKDHRAFTYSRRPLKLVWFEEIADKETARQREKQVKSLKRGKKEALTIKEKDSLEEALNSLDQGRRGIKAGGNSG
jgi:putative endonuclease